MTIQLLTSKYLLDSPSLLHGKRFRIHGSLIVTDKSSWIEFDDDDSGSCLQIGDDNLIKKLLDTVPCYLGGQYLYHDPVNLICVLEKTKDNGVRISRVESGELIRDGDNFTF